MMIETTLGPLDGRLLIKHEDATDNDNECTLVVEYCLSGCNGPAHITDTPDSETFFCAQHVHRSVNIALKKVAFSESEVGIIG